MWSQRANALSGGGGGPGFSPKPGGDGPGFGAPFDAAPTLPPVPASFPELDRMSQSQLEALFTNENELANFVRKHEYVEKVARSLQELRQEIEQMTKSNEAKLNEAHSSQSQEEAERERHLEDQLREQIKAKEEEKARLWEFNSPIAIHDRLQLALTGSEEICANIKTQFLEREITLADFIKLYTKERKRYHQISSLIEDISPLL